MFLSSIEILVLFVRSQPTSPTAGAFGAPRSVNGIIPKIEKSFYFLNFKINSKNEKNNDFFVCFNAFLQYFDCL